MQLLFEIFDCLRGRMSPQPERLSVLRAHGVVCLLPFHPDDSWKQETKRQFAYAELIKRDFLDVTATLASNHIPFVPLKGLLLSEMLYGNYAVRPGSDIDIAVSREHYNAALGCLLTANHKHKPARYTKSTVEIFSCKQHRNVLELHFAISTAERFSNFFQALLESCRNHRFENQVYEIPRHEMYLCYLLIHLARHFFEPRAIWIEDIGLYLKKYGDQIDWERFVGIAKNHRLGNALAITMKLCNTIFSRYDETLFSEDVLNRIENLRSQHGKVLYSYLLQKLERNNVTPALRRLHAFGLAENWQDRIAIVRHSIFSRVHFTATAP